MQATNNISMQVPHWSTAVTRHQRSNNLNAGRYLPCESTLKRFLLLPHPVHVWISLISGDVGLVRLKVRRFSEACLLQSQPRRCEQVSDAVRQKSICLFALLKPRGEMSSICWTGSSVVKLDGCVYQESISTQREGRKIKATVCSTFYATGYAENAFAKSRLALLYCSIGEQTISRKTSNTSNTSLS